MPTPKNTSKKKIKKTPSKYEEKFFVIGTFEEVIKKLATPKKANPTQEKNN